jgi:acylphosphatase
MTARRFLVSGRVQGVGFRHFVITRAAEQKLIGWTRNLADGRVEVLAQGEVESLEALQSHLAAGPRFAQVTAVETEVVEVDPDLQGFGVRH